MFSVFTLQQTSPGDPGIVYESTPEVGAMGRATAMAVPVSVPMIATGEAGLRGHHQKAQG